jgi:N-acetylmuramoyl-L-alanine amidase
MIFKDVSEYTSPQVLGKRLNSRRGIVIHETIGFDSLTWLQGGSALVGRPASSDFLISKQGIIYQITPPGSFAYHSGPAKWRGYQEPDTSINQGFYGIELENEPTRGQRINTVQYIGLAWLVRLLVSHSPIDLRDIAGHGQVALPPGRKTDPITLNWMMLTSELIHPSNEANLYEFRGELS